MGEEYIFSPIQDEASMVKEAQQNGTMDNPELDPPDVTYVNKD